MTAIKQILDAARIEPAAVADAVGINRGVFAEILSGQRDLPQSYVPLLSAVLGVADEALKGTRGGAKDLTPAIWYKFRGEALTDADREYVLSVRQLAFYQHELETLIDASSVGWRTLFEEIRRNNEPQAAPRAQGVSAARLFRRLTALDQAATGIGEVFRGYLRTLGILVIEAPVSDSLMEGCSFLAGPVGNERPCIFANSYRLTWFRRNSVLFHELAHSVFDVESSTASLDIANGASRDEVLEERADAFAQECLVPKTVLRHWGQRIGIQWNAMSREQLAELIASTHAEQRIVIRALVDSELVSQNAADELSSMDTASLLHGLSDRALTTDEYIRKVGAEKAEWLTKRSTSRSPRKLLLPSKYVDSVASAYHDALISRSKAAQMLMIEESQLEDRFPLLEPAEV
jgi:Zn-dependent peptidase ImmA (M78 family)